MSQEVMEQIQRFYAEHGYIIAAVTGPLEMEQVVGADKCTDEEPMPLQVKGPATEEEFQEMLAGLPGDPGRNYSARQRMRGFDTYFYRVVIPD